MSEMPFSDPRCSTEVYTGQETHRCILEAGHSGDCIPADRAPSSLAPEFTQEALAERVIDNVDDLLKDILGDEDVAV